MDGELLFKYFLLIPQLCRPWRPALLVPAYIRWTLNVPEKRAIAKYAARTLRRGENWLEGLRVLCINNEWRFLETSRTQLNVNKKKKKRWVSVLITNVYNYSIIRIGLKWTVDPRYHFIYLVTHCASGNSCCYRLLSGTSVIRSRMKCTFVSLKVVVHVAHGSIYWPWRVTPAWGSCLRNSRWTSCLAVIQPGSACVRVSHSCMFLLLNISYLHFVERPRFEKW